ncbi:MAG TPA: arginine--tRNA ligase [Candidatus Saccharibacteria bacterium]|nr:arginine--tRNA ligase [Candidatus Saccharibacteria bacterium]
MHEVKKLLLQAVKDAYNEDIEIVLTRPDEKFGDFATNVALQLGKKVGQKPRDIAEKIASEISKDEKVAKAEVAGPGFINITMTDQEIFNSADKAATIKPQTYKDEVVVAEYSDPNPFKVLHAGHVYTTVVGDGIATLFEIAGAKVHRVNFGGDVGRHVAITMWVILQKLGGENPEKLTSIPEKDRTQWLADCYVEGNNIFETDDQIKVEMIALNKRIYKIHSDNDHDSDFAKIYWLARQWSYEAFDAFYDRLGTKMEKYYPESEVADLGITKVKEQLAKGVFEESDGAVIFPGEKYDLHTRVFINSEGLPTYEAKDIGVVLQKYEDYHFDRSVIVTDNEQQQYMSVIIKAIEQFAPKLAKATTYIPHGKVKLAGGVKMSSRKGNIIKASEVLDVTAEALRESDRNADEDVVLAAVKYAFLKYRIGGDIIYDPKESVSLQGNSGPYLQYAHARACSILAKVKSSKPTEHNFEPMERSLARKIGEYPEVVEKAVTDLMPHHIAVYLYELAQAFNRFYEKNRVVDDAREAIRVQLVKAYRDTLADGLSILKIKAPEKM